MKIFEDWLNEAEHIISYWDTITKEQFIKGVQSGKCLLVGCPDAKSKDEHYVNNVMSHRELSLENLKRASKLHIEDNPKWLEIKSVSQSHLSFSVPNSTFYSNATLDFNKKDTECFFGKKNINNGTLYMFYLKIKKSKTYHHVPYIFYVEG